MLSLEKIREILNTYSYLELQKMANEVDVSFDTLVSIKTGRANNPRYNTIISISGYLLNGLQSSNK